MVFTREPVFLQWISSDLHVGFYSSQGLSEGKFLGSELFEAIANVSYIFTRPKF